MTYREIGGAGKWDKNAEWEDARQSWRVNKKPILTEFLHSSGCRGVRHLTTIEASVARKWDSNDGISSEGEHDVSTGATDWLRPSVFLKTPRVTTLSSTSSITPNSRSTSKSTKWKTLSCINRFGLLWLEEFEYEWFRSRCQSERLATTLI